MACIDRNTWSAAVAACNAQQSVKGLSGGMGIWSHKRRTAQAGLGILGDTNTLNVAPTTGVDPCAIAKQSPCPPGLKAATNTNHVTVIDSLVPPPPTPDDSTKKAGYMKLGLLAVVVVVGGAVAYKTFHKKKAS